MCIPNTQGSNKDSYVYQLILITLINPRNVPNVSINLKDV